MLLAVAGWPNPNGVLTTGSFKIVQNKRTGVTTTSMSGNVTFPELLLGSTVQARITIELFDVLAGGGDCVLSEEKTLPVSDRPKSLIIGQ